MDRRRHGDGVDIDGQAPTSLLLDEHAVVREHHDELAHEKRIASGRRGEPAQELVGQLCGPEHVGGEFGCRTRRPGR